ncbi:MAG: AAA family ATPase [Oribacterium sp.]|nr:AAA family ATPase [Oribacterium sp.]MDY6307518.1 AAA family ATPase [Oribacterium sp.]
MERLRCVVERITYQNAENGYSVIKCRVKNYTDLVTVIGMMPDVHVGSVLSLTGQWKIDAKYGRQFQMETFEETLPATVFGMEKYLGSGLIKGIGPVYAKKIVNAFGQETLNVIEETPERLLEIPGIGRSRVESIKKSWKEQAEIKNIMLFLQSHDVSTAHATKIYKTYGNESIKIVQENPYRLADDIWGIGFKTADTIAEKMGFGHEKYARLRSGIFYTLNKLSEEGHCYAKRKDLLSAGAELLSVDENLLSMTLDEMIHQEDVIIDTVPEETNADERGVGGKAEDASTSGNYADILELRTAAQLSRVAEAGTTYGNSSKISHIQTFSDANAYSLQSDGDSSTTETTHSASDIKKSDDPMEKAVYLPPFYFAERGTAKRLVSILRGNSSILVKTDGLEQRIAAKTGMQYDEIQMQAIRTAANCKVLVLTGGPGTGKTTTTLGIITALKESGAKILLAAPTGRAAKRLSEATGMEAKTIHRLLEYKPPEGYQKNDEHPLEGDALIVDECSMIDILLMYNLLKAVPDTMRLVLVGDIDQLPSVGAGNVLRDVIASGCVPVVRLTRIFRQAQKSRIIMNAHRINEGKMPDLSNGRNSDFFFIAEEDPDKAVETIVGLVQTKLSRYYHVRPQDIQVLTPMLKGVVGASNLNQSLQAALNTNSVGLRHGGVMYRKQDKVMQIRNNYDKEVFNGDIGIVASVDTEDRSLKVDFDGRLVEYDISELDELVLAYATTIHKAQGSEYPIVVMPVMMNHFVMLQRNLIYTGITRAKKILVIVGTKKALAYAVKHVTVTERNTMLKERIQKQCR